MKSGIGVFLLGALFAAGFALGRAGAGEEGDAKDDAAAWMELARPGPQHAELMKLAGTWKVQGKSWMDPAADPVEYAGESVFTPVLGGRFLRQEVHTPMMGMDFEGVGYLGFDKAIGKYVTVWLDSMGTGIMNLVGEQTVPGKAWSYAGKYHGPGGQAVSFRQEISLTGADGITMEMYVDYGQGEAKCMEQVYTRAS